MERRKRKQHQHSRVIVNREVLNCCGVRLTARSVSILHVAVTRVADAVVVCETLLARGSDIDATDRNGYTPLMLAVRSETKTTDVVRLLLALNADTTKTNNRGWNVSQTRHAKRLQLLSEHSKKTVSLIALRHFCLMLFRRQNVNKRAWKRWLEFDRMLLSVSCDALNPKSLASVSHSHRSTYRRTCCFGSSIGFRATICSRITRRFISSNPL